MTLGRCRVRDKAWLSQFFPTPPPCLPPFSVSPPLCRPRRPTPLFPPPPTPRVIQYTGTRPLTPPQPVSHNPTTPTWTVAVSRPVSSTTRPALGSLAVRPARPPA